MTCPVSLKAPRTKDSCFLSYRTEDRVDAATDDCDRCWTRRLGVFASVLTPKAVLH